MQRYLLPFASVLAAVGAQSTGSYQTETHPSMTWQQCTAKGSCTSKSGKVVIDSNWRWVHKTGDYKNCYTGNKWDSTLCAKNADCTKNCVLEGADYTKTYGVSASGNALTLTFVTKGSDSTNIGSRLYLMESDTKYQMFSLLNKEFTFDVDLSGLGCGLNGAVYLVSMDADGGTGKYSTNKAGAKYGTGYCDAQCPRDLKFINGEANAENWQASKNDQNAGVGAYGSCCAEMDLWEANSISTAVTPHSCKTIAQSRCSGDACGGTYSETRYAGVCDPDGCDFNSYRQGNKSFYGPGMIVDTKSKFTIVTQFIGSPLTEIKRFYVQGGKVIPNSESTIAGNPGNSITPEFCKAQKVVFQDRDTFNEQGGFPSMSEALDKGMVLVMSLWDDHYSNMLWLDSTYPTDANPETPGKGRGSCETSSGVPTDVESKQASSKVTYSNIKVGPIGSTFG